MTFADTQPAGFLERRAPWVVFALGLLLLLPSIWSETSVTGGDEYTLSLRTPMEMRERGEWLTPWLNGEPRLRKPPLVYWAIRATYDGFGVSLASARFWGVLAGAALAACASLLARELFGRHALPAGLLALATMGVGIEGRRAMLDLPVAAFSGFAVIYLLRWGRAGRGRELSVAAALLALGVLVKGPVALLFGGSALAAWLFVFQGIAVVRERWPHVLAATGVFLLVALPWPVAIYLRWGERLTGILREELADRHFGSLSAGSPLSAWTGALGLLFPWSLLVLAALAAWWRHRRGDDARARLWLILWMVLSALPFFFMKAFERYMLALIPAQAVLAAAWLGDGNDRLRRVLLGISAGLLSFVALAVVAFAWWFLVGSWEPMLVLLASASLLVCVLRGAGTSLVALAAAVVFTLTLGVLYPRFGIGSLPRLLPPECARVPCRQFASSQPGMLSSRLGYSVQPFDPRRLAAERGGWEVVFVEAPNRAGFEALLKEHSLPMRELATFRTFYSRKAWTRFARADATAADWREAWRTRSLEGLKTTFHIILVGGAGAPP